MVGDYIYDTHEKSALPGMWTKTPGVRKRAIRSRIIRCQKLSGIIAYTVWNLYNWCLQFYAFLIIGREVDPGGDSPY